MIIVLPVQSERSRGSKRNTNIDSLKVILLLRAYALHVGNQKVKWFLVSIIVVSMPRSSMFFTWNDSPLR